MAVIRMLFAIGIGLDCLSLVLGHGQLSAPSSLHLCNAQKSPDPARQLRRAGTLCVKHKAWLYDDVCILDTAENRCIHSRSNLLHQLDDHLEHLID